MRTSNCVFISLVFFLVISVINAKKQTKRKTNVIPERIPEKVSNEPKHPKLKAYTENAHLRPTKCQGKLRLLTTLTCTQ